MIIIKINNNAFYCKDFSGVKFVLKSEFETYLPSRYRKLYLEQIERGITKENLDKEIILLDEKDRQIHIYLKYVNLI